MLSIKKLLKARRFSVNILILNLRAKFRIKISTFNYFNAFFKKQTNKKRRNWQRERKKIKFKVEIQNRTVVGLCWLRALRWPEHVARCSTESRIAYDICVPLAIVSPTMPASVYQFDELRLDRAICNWIQTCTFLMKMKSHRQYFGRWSSVVLRLTKVHTLLVTNRYLAALATIRLELIVRWMWVGPAATAILLLTALKPTKNKYKNI